MFSFHHLQLWKKQFSISMFDIDIILRRVQTSSLAADTFFSVERNRVLTLFRMDPFGAGNGYGGVGKKAPLPKIFHTYLIVMKLGTFIPCWKKTKKYLNHVTHSLSWADISIFSSEISKFCYIRKYRYRLHFGAKFLFFLTFFESWKIFLIKKATV